MDANGQVTERQIPITVNHDLVPKPQIHHLDFPLAGIYGDQLIGKLTNINTIDDGRLEDAIIDLVVSNNSSVIREINVCDKNLGIRCLQTMPRVINLPSAPIDGDILNIALRVTDKLGQVGISESISISLSQHPNAILVNQTPSANLAIATVGVPADFAF